MFRFRFDAPLFPRSTVETGCGDDLSPGYVNGSAIVDAEFSVFDDIWNFNVTSDLRFPSSTSKFPYDDPNFIFCCANLIKYLIAIFVLDCSYLPTQYLSKKRVRICPWSKVCSRISSNFNASKAIVMLGLNKLENSGEVNNSWLCGDLVISIASVFDYAFVAIVRTTEGLQ
ncbi:hypothetical protein T440DRAFT_518698 [Plenodomus tracheiphilus IPT5]|uniref:Uncharacterized protein n=1 Tax=Plenodomus tracheiphilus IPT5 TaxID=1408161 RepID=A0A6A7B565_9PLEO|nr:hypothetical protein T440DRAFT_518698 [Plenodomus tracheiphilus IPT5]